MKWRSGSPSAMQPRRPVREVAEPLLVADRDAAVRARAAAVDALAALGREQGDDVVARPDESRVTGPTASTTPAPSWPSTQGAYPVGSAPEAVYMSVWQTPQAASRTSASPAFGSSSCTSWTTRGCPNSSRTAARTFRSVRWRRRDPGRTSRSRAPRTRSTRTCRRRGRARSVVSRSGWNVSHMTASSCVSVSPIDFSARPGCGPCGMPDGMQRDRADVDALPRGEVARRRNRSSPRCSHSSGGTGSGSPAGRSRACAGRTSRSRSSGPANVWCDGGGMWMRPVIGSKSWMLNVHG